MNSDSYYQNGENLGFVASTHEEERALFARAKAGDELAKEKIIRDHLLLVANIARRLVRGKLPENDIISAANFALVKAFENFKPESATRFSGFVPLYVRGEIARLWNDQNLVSKNRRDRNSLCKTVPIEEDILLDEEDSGDADHKAFLISLLKDSKEVLDDREQKILGLIYSEAPMTLVEVSRAYKISRERVRQIHDAAVAKLGRELRRKMNENGVNQ